MRPGWLTGWKAIAAYLNVSERTAKTYRVEFHMPVHRGPTGKPVVNIVELDLWMKNVLNKAPVRFALNLHEVCTSIDTRKRLD